MIGEQLKNLRKKKGLTQEQLAEELNVSRQAIAKWETDKGMPDIENLKAIGVFFQIPLDELVNNTPMQNRSLKMKFLLAEIFAFCIGISLWLVSQNFLFGFTLTVLLPSIVWIFEKIALDFHYQKNKNETGQKDNLKELLPKNWYGRILDISNSKPAKLSRLKWYFIEAFGISALMTVFDITAQYFGTFSRDLSFAIPPAANLLLEFLLLFTVMFVCNSIINELVIKKYNRIK